jgi:hypothetical protein
MLNQFPKVSRPLSWAWSQYTRQYEAGGNWAIFYLQYS